MTELDQSLKVAVAKDPEVRVTVVICTLNRADVIGDALRSVVDQTVAPGSLEILVVDNGSSDGTPELVTQLARRHENVRLLHEPTLGLSAARNRGAAEAKGMIVAYIDDDAIADPRWLESLLATYAEAPEAVAVGGPVSLGFPNGQPTWAPRRALAAWGQLDLGPNRLEVHGLHGGNMSIRRDVLVDVGGFDPRLGRKGRALIGGEESDLFVRIVRAGIGSILYEPTARVVHRVGSERRGLWWLLRRAWGDGRTTALWRPPVPRSHPLASLTKAGGNLAIAAGLFTVGWMSRDYKKMALTRAMRVAFHLGMISVPRSKTHIDGRPGPAGTESG